jgi:hypothetical protein
MSTSKAIKEAIWIKKFIIELCVVSNIVDLVVLYSDNNGVIV